MAFLLISYESIDMGYIFTQLARFAETSIMAAGAHLAIVGSGIFFLGIPVSFALSAYVLAITQVAGWPLFVSVMTAICAVLVASAVFVLAYLKLSADGFTVFTLASILAFDAAVKSWDSVTGGVLGIAGISRPNFLSSLPELAIFQLVIMALAFLVEYIIFQTKFGRTLLAMKESPEIVDSLGISSRRAGAAVIVISSLAAAISGIISLWRIRFIDPSFGGVMILIQVVTIAIIAAKPKVRWLALSSLAIVLLPEVLRFLSLPSTMVGHARNLLYAVSLILIVKNISSSLLPKKRFV
jgi:branched-chain amino acid transport system permease protein